MTEEEFTNLLGYFIDEYADIDNNGYEDDGVADERYPELKDVSVRTFDDVGMLTMNKGLVVRLSDGSEYQLIIVRSK